MDNPTVRLQQLRLPKAAELVSQSIRQGVIQGELAEGALLPSMSVMAEQLGVSPATVREAVRILETEGLVSVKSGPKGGAVICRPTTDSLTRSLSFLIQFERVTLGELLEAREGIELYSVALAAVRATPEDVAGWHRTLERLEAARSAEEHVAVNLDFHLRIAAAAHNPILCIFLDPLRDLIHWSTAGAGMSTEERGQTLVAHRRIVAALEARDPEAATRRMRRHLQAFRQFLQDCGPSLLQQPVMMYPTSLARTTDTRSANHAARRN